jgi:hypothetical protein
MTAIRWYREQALLAVLVVAAGAGATLGQTGSSLGGVSVSRGKSQMDDSRWARLTVSAQSAIRVFPGRVVYPRLEIQCVQGDDQVVARQYQGHFHVIIYNAGQVDREYNGKIRLDDEEAEAIGLRQRSDGSSYDIGSEELIQRILTSKIARVQFVSLFEGSVVAKFDVHGFKAAFARQPECLGPAALR